MPERACPYAAALSDDEDASYHEIPTSAEALSAARLKCPAFANNACPFRDTGADPNSLMEVMKTVPPSHFPSSSSALTKVVARQNSNDGEEEGGSDTAASAQFQLAMEHVHQVSSWLEHGTNSPRNSSPTILNHSNALTKNDRDSFIIRGGCPFKSYHKERDNDNTSKHMARAMEDFSLAAIMGRMASESFNWDDDLELELELERIGEEILERDNNTEATITNPTTQKQAISSISKDNQQQKGDSHTGRASFLSQALKTGTAVSHTAAENVHFVNNFIQGKIDRELYMDLLSGLYHTYIALESLLDEHAPTHFPTLHFPKELSRTEALKEDMEYWHGLNWETKPECAKPSPAVQDYIDRMREVGRIDPLLLLSHAYTRYLGDLSGGKVLSRIARRALNLNGYDGLQFYQFDHVTSAKLFKDKYRLALDELVLTPDQIGSAVAEANVAFALNMRVFEELDVKGGVEGARLRNVREALVYYDVEMEEQIKRNNSVGGSSRGSFDVGEDSGEEAKCPFGFKGPNPHAPKVETDATASENVQTTAPKLQPQTAVVTKEHSPKGGRCPWPFVFFHDPVMGMKDWQTWLVIGLILCWSWYCIVQPGDEEISLDEAAAAILTESDDIIEASAGAEIRYWEL